MYFSKTSVFNSILPHEIFSIKANYTLKILGVIFDPKLNFEEHFNLVVKRASQRLHFLLVLQQIYHMTNYGRILTRWFAQF